MNSKIWSADIISFQFPLRDKSNHESILRCLPIFLYTGYEADLHKGLMVGVIFPQKLTIILEFDVTSVWTFFSISTYFSYIRCSFLLPSGYMSHDSHHICPEIVFVICQYRWTTTITFTVNLHM